jgi:hypothetical protein
MSEEKNTEQSSEPVRPDALDLPSGVAVEVTRNGVRGQIELSFRELQQYTAKEIKLWDTLGTRDRLTVQKAYDPNYRPISPFEGTERARANRGKRPSAMRRSMAGKSG